MSVTYNTNPNNNNDTLLFNCHNWFCFVYIHQSIFLNWNCLLVLFGSLESLSFSMDLTLSMNLTRIFESKGLGLTYLLTVFSKFLISNLIWTATKATWNSRKLTNFLFFFLFLRRSPSSATQYKITKSLCCFLSLLFLIFYVCITGSDFILGGFIIMTSIEFYQFVSLFELTNFISIRSFDQIIYNLLANIYIIQLYLNYCCLPWCLIFTLENSFFFFSF